MIKYYIVRFIAWDAFHDIHQIGMSFEEKKDLITLLSSYGKVYISSENPLPPEFEPYRLSINIKDIHHVLAFAHLFIGESGTMATESSILGTFSVIINPLSKSCRNFLELQNKHNIHNFFDSYLEAKDIILKLLENNDLKKLSKNSAKSLIEKKIDMNDYLLNLINLK